MILTTDLPNILYKGKVRETYDLGNDSLLMIATDRISAFDVVLPTGIPEKGLILSRMSAFWFSKTSHIVPNHFISMADESEDLLENSPIGPIPSAIAKQGMVVKRAKRIDIECIIRGYLAGSAWAEYQKQGTVFGKTMPKGLLEGSKFDEPIFTPTSKAEEGHDENMSIPEVENMVGKQIADELAEKSLALYAFARDYASTRGIILADTKLEFGYIDGKVTLIDEAFTPDSSRFWDTSLYKPGSSPPNFDKQFVRDWLMEQGWNKQPPAPPLPPEVIEKTVERYREAYKRITNETLA